MPVRTARAVSAARLQPIVDRVFPWLEARAALEQAEASLAARNSELAGETARANKAEEGEADAVVTLPLAAAEDAAGTTVDAAVGRALED